MSDLVSRVLAAIEETERKARRAIFSDTGEWTRIYKGNVAIRDSNGSPVVYDEGAPTAEESDHIAHNDPAAVLRRCAADRAAVERYMSLWSEQAGFTRKTLCREGDDR